MDQQAHFGARRLKVAHRYNQIFTEFTGVTKPLQYEYNANIFYLCVILFDFKNLGGSREQQ